MEELIKFLDKYHVQYTIEDGIIIADNIDLSHNQITHLPESFENLCCNEIYLSYNKLTTLPESFGNIRCKYIYLSSNQITHLPESFGNLRCERIDLDNNQITHLPESFCNLRCNEIYLSYNKITTLPESFGNLRCNYIDLSNNQITSLTDSFRNIRCNYIHLSHNLIKNIPDTQSFSSIEITDNYVYSDGILFWYDSIKIIDRYKVYIGYNKLLVSLNDKVFAHANSIRQGISDILFKTSDRDKSKYKDLSLETMFNIEEAIVMYRTITGACSGGVESFISNKTFNPTISIQEISDMLNDEFGAKEFKDFFTIV